MAIDLATLRPRNRAGSVYCAVAALLTAAALTLGSASGWLPWLAGQLLLALALLVWFVLLHEAGHHTLFRTRVLNTLAGHIASVPSFIPYATWQRVHARHHLWTGWQDLDLTTASLVPRPLARFERVAINFAWKTGFPLFSILYRLTNFWHLPRLAPYFGSREWRLIVANTLALLALYALVGAWVGTGRAVEIAGLGVLLGLALQDPIILSQHTHIPQNLSEGRFVTPFPAREQEQFTRSLRLPAWLSWLILHFDAHELHHMHVQVPGYDLRRIDYRPRHEVDWWTWLRGAKRLPGEVFLFRNSTQTGFTL
jgi:fatty acid desaturase